MNISIINNNIQKAGSALDRLGEKQDRDLPHSMRPADPTMTLLVTRSAQAAVTEKTTQMLLSEAGSVVRGCEGGKVAGWVDRGREERTGQGGHREG